MDSTKTCSICLKNYRGFGNNAWPVNDGRCCDKCNWTKVVPKRLEKVFRIERPRKRKPKLTVVK